MVGRTSTWSSEDDERLRKLAQEGLNAREIAEHMKRTPDAIRRRSMLHNICIAKAANGIPWSENEDVRLRQLAQSGLSVPEIAADMRRSTSMVRRRADKLELRIARGVNGVTRAVLEERLNRESRPSERIEALRHSVSAGQIGLKAKE